MTIAGDVDAIARRNAITLALANALYGSVTTMQVATTGLVGAQIAPSLAWATLPMSMFVVGTASTTMPISLLMRRIGRRAGFILGSAVGAFGALLGTYAIYERAFFLFLLASFLIGAFQASASYYRFAAADSASVAFRPKAISWVMTGGVAAALFGTLLVMGTAEMLAPVTFAGSWLVMAGLAIANIILLLTLKMPPPAAAESDIAQARPLSEIAGQRRYLVAAATAMVAYAVMVLVMTATPVAMLGCGFSYSDSSWVIQWHALAMFVPSFFTGTIIARFGAEKVSATGMAILMGAGIAGLAGIDFANFAVGLILLGLGWNFGFIGGTTMLTSTYAASERNKAQGLNDFLVFGMTALSSLAAGKLLAWFGWNAVNYAVFPLAALALALLFWLSLGERRRRLA